jgi:hypothetical protein
VRGREPRGHVDRIGKGLELDAARRELVNRRDELVPTIGLSRSVCINFLELAVRMREHDRVDMVDTLADQERNDDPFPDGFSDGASVLSRPALELPARVEHDRVPTRRLNDDRVTLADIQERDPQIVTRRTRRPEDERAGRRDDG